MRKRRGKDPATGFSNGLDSNKGSLGKDRSFHPRSPRKVFLFCLAFRIVDALLIQTRFHPDEHWQGPEVAHHLAFGYGQLTWELEKGLRGYLHPMIFAALYKVLAAMGLDTPWFMLPCSMFYYQCSEIAAVGVLCVEMIFLRTFNSHQLFSELTNWFMSFCFRRTILEQEKRSLTLKKMGIGVGSHFLCDQTDQCITWLCIVGLLELYLCHDRLKFIFLEALPIG
ncbi:hypothetical protein MLD38_015768 [Melastoma candidum]|uniref:Uncharacterized protein n=1 Tax=Melastoma candidum TaxID=119954 RepID=A0ACB9RGU8_9MYRT|nr:hypothetical protein MLD38_015768 [Melastoma candidum]